MVFFNYSTMQMVVKVVYYGPGLCGKTTNLEFIYSKTAANSRGEMVSLETETDRTLFFDLLPIDVGVIGGFKTKFQLYTVPGQVFYNSTRKLVLKGVDGLIFVADSQEPMLDANLESFENLKENLSEIGMTINDIPIVFQYNKRDLNNILPVDELNNALNPMGFPYVEASAITGQGVFDTLKLISKHTLFSVKKTMTGKKEKEEEKLERKDEFLEEKKEVKEVEPSSESSDVFEDQSNSKSDSYEKEMSEDYFEEEDLVLDEDEDEVEKETIQKPQLKEKVQVKQEPDTEKQEEKAPVIEKSKKPEIVSPKTKKTKSIGLSSVDDLLNDLMPTKQTFTKQVKFEIDKKIFKDITSATINIDFKDENGDIIETKSFNSGIQKKKGIKKVLLKYLIDLVQ